MNATVLDGETTLSAPQSKRIVWKRAALYAAIAVTAIAALGEVAIKNNDPTVTKEATEALNKVGSAALSTQSYGVANAVSKSLDNVVYKSKDPEIQGRAWNIKQKIDALNAPVNATSVPP